MFKIVFIKDGVVYVHPYRPPTKAKALAVGHELTRDFVADFFKVTR